MHTVLGEVYTSTDYGDNWKIKHSKGKQMEENLIPANHKISTIILSPADPSIVYFLGTKGVNWFSEDCGVTLKPLNIEKKIQDFKFHPTQREWALASIYTECDDFGDDDCDIHPEIFVTTNMGLKWEKLQNNVIQYEWGKQDSEDGISDKQIIIVKHSDSADIDGPSWSPRNKIILSDDFFKSTRKLVKGGNYFKLTKDYLYSGKVDNKGKKTLTRSLRKYDYTGKED